MAWELPKVPVRAVGSRSGSGRLVDTEPISLSVVSASPGVPAEPLNNPSVPQV
jgi:hypothetical protein